MEDSLLRKKNECIQKLQSEKCKKDPRPDMVITLAILAAQAEIDLIIVRVATGRYENLEANVIITQSILDDIKTWLPKERRSRDTG